VHVLEITDNEDCDDSIEPETFMHWDLNKHPLHILLNSGITQNFLDMQIAKKFVCQIEERETLLVTTADRQHLLSLGCCDLVLGVEWLVTLGDRHTLEF